MKRLFILFGALGLLMLATAGAQAGERHGKYHGGHHSGHHLSHGHYATHYWAKSFFFGQHRAQRHHSQRHEYGYYKKHTHHHGYKKRRILPVKKIVRKLKHRHYHDISKIVLKHDRYKVRAYDRKGRPVKLVVNAHNGRILHRRYR